MTKEWDGEDRRRIDITNIEFGISTVIKIIIGVAIAVSAAVGFQYQIMSNASTLKEIKTTIGAERNPEEGTILYEIDVLKKVQSKKIGPKQFNKFKKWVEKEI